MINDITNSKEYLLFIMFVIMPLNGFLLVELNFFIGLVLILIHVPWALERVAAHQRLEDNDEKDSEATN